VHIHHFGFVSPEFLYTLLVVPAVFALATWIGWSRSRYSVSFTNLELITGIDVPPYRRWRRKFPLILLGLAFAVISLTLARPRVDLFTARADTTIVLVVDCSGSMNAEDIVPSRILAAVGAMRDFLVALPPKDEVGLVTFSDNVEVRDTPTTDYAALDSSLGTLTAQGGTELGDGLEAAIELVVSTLESAGVHRTPGGYLPGAVVLESDGAQDRGLITPQQAAALARASGVRIYGVALGTSKGVITEGRGVFLGTYPVPPDPGTVALLARVSGGEAFNATNATNLFSIYRSLGTSIGRTSQTTELTPWFELAAAILLACAIISARVEGALLP
jgi:Ca-activated chloride channel homolog